MGGVFIGWLWVCIVIGMVWDWLWWYRLKCVFKSEVKRECVCVMWLCVLWFGQGVNVGWLRVVFGCLVGLTCERCAGILGSGFRAIAIPGPIDG